MTAAPAMSAATQVFTAAGVAAVDQHGRSAAAILPKGASLNTYTPDHLRAVEYEINNRPRNILGDRSPAELFIALLTSPDHQLLRR
jgi:hypothetical protein